MWIDQWISEKCYIVEINQEISMTLSLNTIGLFFLALYLLTVGLVGLFGAKIPAKVVAVCALIAGVCILLGVFVTNSISLH
jgi:energy-coupling factor transporter transmembrane protein EcfT